MWSSDHFSLHINFLNLETVVLALKRFQRWLCGTHVLVQMDSITVIHYLNRVGGTRTRRLDLEGLGDYSVVCEVEDLSDSGPHFGP